MSPNYEYCMERPDVYLFNPTCELAVANGSFSYMPPQNLRQFEDDLATLPMFFCQPNDIVLTKGKPSNDFIQQIQEAGFICPEFSSPEMLIQENRQLGLLKPWGWSPAAHFRLEGLKASCPAAYWQSPVANWSENHRQLYERKTSREFLQNLLISFPYDAFCRPEQAPVIITRLDEVDPFLSQHGQIVLKAPLSSSGRGSQFLRKSNLNNAVRQWATGVLNQQGYLMAEPLFPKLADLSFQFEVLPGGQIDYLGTSFFRTNSNGQYNESLINPELNQVISGFEPSAINDLMNITVEVLRNQLCQSVYTRFYEGYLGIDSLLYEENGKLKIQPCLEINCRQNMGIVSLKIARSLHPEAKGSFGIYFNPRMEFNDWANAEGKKHPPMLEDLKLKCGLFPLTDIQTPRNSGAYLRLE